MAEDFTNPFLEDDEDEVAPTSEPALPTLPSALPVPALVRDEEPWPAAEEQVPLPEEDWQPTPPPEDEPWDFSFDDEASEEPLTPVSPAVEEEDPLGLLDAMAGNSNVVEDDWGFDDFSDLASAQAPTEVPPVPEPSVSFIESLDDDDLTDVEEDWGFNFADDEPSAAPEPSLALPLPVEQAPELDDDWGFDFASDEPVPTEEPALPLPPPHEAESPAQPETDWGFFDDEEDLPVPVPTSDPLASVEDEAAGEEDTDWGFFETASEDEIPLDEWGFTDDAAEEPVVEQVPFEDEPEDDAAALARFMEEPVEDDVVEDQTPAPQDDADEDQNDSETMGAKLAALWAQVRSELRGGDDAPAPASQAASQDDDGATGGGAAVGGFLGKIFYPYTWLVGKLLGLILLVLSPLKRVPFLAPFIVANKAFKLIAFVLPIVVVCAVLQWQGSKPLAPSKDLTFPDGGKAGISAFGYDSKNKEAYATVTNKGDVIAEVTPTLEVYSLKRGLNPLSFFFPKPNEKCVGKPVTVQIDASVKVKVECPIDGSAKKVTGELEW